MRVQSFITPETERDGDGQKGERWRYGKGRGEEREDGKRVGERTRKRKQKGGTERDRKGAQRAKIEKCVEKERENTFGR